MRKHVSNTETAVAIAKTVTLRQGNVVPTGTNYLTAVNVPVRNTSDKANIECEK